MFAKSEAKENGFYSKVGELISQPFPNNVRREMEAAWADLEHWSNRVNRGMFGCFNVTVLGQHKFVGMAYAQAMITRKDISGISRLFGSCKLHSGQILTNEHFEKLIEHGKSSYFLSSGLKTAMGKSEYREHLKQLFKVYLELWDGYIPRSIKDCRQEPIKRDERQSLVDDEITIILKPKTVGEEHCWEIGWRLPATVTGQNYAIRFKDCEETKAKLELMGTHIHSISSANQKDAWYTLNQSATEYVDSFLIYTGNDGDRNEKQFYLRQDKVRVLIWDSPDPSLHNSLMEREMPLMGPVYLLYSRINYSNLELYLINEKIEHEMVDANGLPACWGLVCIQNASNLTDEQRALLVENEPAAISKARIRFVGGRPIIGAGSKKYAYYDLPIVELEAPAGAELSSFGLTFKELKDPHGGYLRRFNFCLDESSGSVFKIQAKLGSEILSTVGLHVLTAGGTSISHRSHFSIDNFGRPLADASGLRGAIVGHTQVVVTDSIVDAFRLDKWNRMDIWECMESNVASRFLDSVATTLNGSMNIGVARDQIMRLASSKGLDDIEPNFLIYELRRRGHIEIETDVKGHMVRVCAVPPTLYSLPIKDSEQRQFYGICGSLRLQQWKSLSQATDVKLLIDAESLKDLPSVRVIPIGLEAISSIAKSANFQVADLPIMHLSQWLGSIQELKESLSWYPEQGFEPNDLERLNPALGRFNTAGNVLVDSERKYELL